MNLLTQQLMERVAGIEPASSAWKAEVLPLNYTREPCLPAWAGSASLVLRLSKPLLCRAGVWGRRAPQAPLFGWRGLDYSGCASALRASTASRRCSVACGDTSNRLVQIQPRPEFRRLSERQSRHSGSLHSVDLVEGAGFEPAKLARQIYSLIPLATREPLQKRAYILFLQYQVVNRFPATSRMDMELARGIEPPTG